MSEARRRWAGRLAFPMLALAVVAGQRALAADGSPLWWPAALGCGLAGVLMLRARHA